MDGQFREIESQLRRIRRERVRLDQERQRLLEDQSKLHHCPADQTPACGDLDPRPIELRLHILERKRTRLHQQEADVRRRERDLTVETPSSSSSRSTGSAPRVWQSVLYSARRRPRGRQGRPVEGPATEVSSSEPGHTNTVLSQFEALTLNTMPPTVGSADRVEECAREVSSSGGPIITDLPEFEAPALNELPFKLQSPYWCNLRDDTGSSDAESETVEDNPNEESDFDLDKELQKLEEYLESHTSDTISEGMDKILAVERATLAAEYDKMSAAKRADIAARSSHFAKRFPTWCLPSPAASEAQSLQATEQASSAEPSRQHLLRRQPRREVSDEEIIQNGKNWMKKEVMLAFDKYKERSSNLKGLDCQFERLDHQCFNVEHYNKIFHHYNFTVKITNPSSSDSREALFFAEVKEILGRPYYFCCPLEQNENGRCYACHNQQMDDLQHPATGGYERGSTDTVFPFMYI